MISDQVVGAPSHDDAGIKETQLQLPQVLFAAAIGKRDDSRDSHALRSRRRSQRELNISAIEPENGNLHARLRTPDGRQ